MSIFQTRHVLQTPEYDKYGRITDETKQDRTYICSSGMSDIIRLTVIQDVNGRQTNVAIYLTVDDVRELASALNIAADHVEDR